ncbi:MAG: TlpA disulfide reductase family protein [Bergeyella sp.]
MNIKLNLYILLLLIFSTNAFAQSNYYSILGEKPMSEQDYQKVKENIAEQGKIEELILKTETKKDSVIKYVKVENVALLPDGTDPYGEIRKLINNHFPIEKFINEKGKNFSKKHFKGKPTIINFWFTRCPPCIEELPILNQLKEKYGDKVNFISITFENKKAMDEFLKKHKYDFKHILDSKKQIDELNISAYPSNLILDKNGVVKFANGDVSTYNVKEIEAILEILQ